MIRKKLVLSRSTIGYIMLFMILFMSSSFTVLNQLVNDALVKGLWLVILAVLLLCMRSMKKRTTYAFLGICGIVLISGILSDEHIVLILQRLIIFASAWLFCIDFTFEEMREDYIGIMRNLSIISLIMLTVFTVLPGLRTPFLVQNLNGNWYANILVYVHIAQKNSLARNCGMFWEPGAMSFFTLVALYFEITKENYSRRKIILFIVTVITTFSTTGYVCLAALMLYFYLKNFYHGKRNVQIFFLGAVLLLALYFAQDFLFQAGSYSTFGKLFDFFKNPELEKANTSVAFRINAVIRPVGLVFQHPLFGVGNPGLHELLYRYTQGINTCTMVNWFAIYGVPFGILMNIGLLSFLKQINRTWFFTLFSYFIFFVLTVSENFANDPLVLLLILYGFQQFSRSRQRGKTVNHDGMRKVQDG